MSIGKSEMVFLFCTVVSTLNKTLFLMKKKKKKGRDITLPTKVCLVKAAVFPVIMYGCES